MRVAGLAAHASQKRGEHKRSATYAVALGLATASVISAPPLTRGVRGVRGVVDESVPRMKSCSVSGEGRLRGSELERGVIVVRPGDGCTV